jgi:hypothetical protein
MTEYNYPKEKPDHHEQILVDLGGNEEFRWWLCYFFILTIVRDLLQQKMEMSLKFL